MPTSASLACKSLAELPDSNDVMNTDRLCLERLGGEVCLDLRLEVLTSWLRSLFDPSSDDSVTRLVAMDLLFVVSFADTCCCFAGVTSERRFEFGTGIREASA